MNPEQWLSLKWNGGSTMSDRWLNQSKIIHAISFFLAFIHKNNNNETTTPANINEPTNNLFEIE